MQSYPRHGTSRYVFATFILALVTLGSTPLIPYLDLANIVMLFLLVVFMVAPSLGRGPAIMSAILAVALFDYFFVPPRFSFAVHDAQYLVTFLVMLCIGLVTAHLTSRLQRQTLEAVARGQDTYRLYGLARALAGATAYEQVAEVVRTYLTNSGYQSALHQMDADGDLPTLKYEVLIRRLALSALQQASAVNVSQLSTDGRQALVIPIKSASRKFGVLVVREGASFPEDRHLDAKQLEAVADLVLIALERLHFDALAQATQLEASSERLRSSILSALSHDLRTPLTGLVGMADALAMSAETKDARIQEAAGSIRDQARTLHKLLSNLLDMARLNAGKVELRMEWQLFEDVIGASIQLLKPALLQHPVSVQLESDLPLVNFDAVLIERVLCNLLENAAKFSPAKLGIEIRGFLDGQFACISIRDHGPGFPTAHPDRLFQMFSRGDAESRMPGVGMGLAICKAIMDAHHGTIVAESPPDGGARVTIALPLGIPPEFSPEAEAER